MVILPYIFTGHKKEPLYNRGSFFIADKIFSYGNNRN